MGFTILELSKVLLNEFFYKRLEPYWQNKEQLYCMDTDCFVLSFHANNQELTNILQQNKDKFDFNELDKSMNFHLRHVY